MVLNVSIEGKRDHHKNPQSFREKLRHNRLAYFGSILFPIPTTNLSPLCEFEPAE